MPSSQGKLKPFVSVSTSTEIHNSVGYPVGGNVTSTTSANFKASFVAGTNVIYVTYVTSGTVVPGMAVSGIGLAPGSLIMGPLNQNGTGVGGVGSYTVNNLTLSSQGVSVPPSAGQYNLLSTAGTTVVGQATQSSVSSGPGGVVGPVPGFNCVNIQDLRDYYNLPYPPATPLASPPVIAIVSFGGGIYGQPVTTGQYAGFWKCTDISGNNGAPIQILVAPINGAINAPNADDGGATLENTVDVATVNAFYGMIDPRRDAPVYTPPVIILYIAPSSDISEMYRTFYTVLKNPVVCNGKSYQPSVVTCSWGAPEIAWTQKMAFPPNSSIPLDTSPNPEGIAEMNEINNLLAEATQNGINICCASGDIPLDTVNSSVNTYNYAQSLLLQGLNGPGYSGQVAQPQPTVFPLTAAARASLPPPQVMFPASSPYVTCVGGSCVYFPNIGVGSYANASEFAWARGNGGISSAFSIPAYQQNQPGAASTSAAQFLASSLNTANLAQTALGTPAPVYNAISGGYTAPNTAVTLATQTKNDAYTATLNAFNSAQSALFAAQLSSTDDALMNSLVQTVKAASTSLATAESNRELADSAKEAAEDFVVKTQTVSQLLVTAGTVFGAAAGVTAATSATGQSVLTAQMAAQQAAYNQLIAPTTTNAMLLQNANQALQAAHAAANASALASVTLPAAVSDSTDVANKAVEQAAAAVIAPSLAAHPYLQGIPITSPLPIKSNAAYNTAQTVAGSLSYDTTVSTAPSYLLSALGSSYNADQPVNGVNISGNNNLRQRLQDSVLAADELTYALVNVAPAHLSDDSISNTKGQPALVGEVASLTDKQIFAVQGQDVSGSDVAGITAVIARTDSSGNGVGYLELLPSVGLGSVYSGSDANASLFATRAATISSEGAALISSYQSGAADSNSDGYGLPCGLASANASILATIYTVTSAEKEADKEAGFPYGSTDTSGGVDASGTYNGITPGLINLRNIYANTTLSARRMTTAHKAAQDVKEAFLVWSNANDLVSSLQSEATSLFNTVPTPSNDQVLKMDAELLAAKTSLSAATYALGLAENYAVSTARLAQQSAASTSLVMGNYIDSAGTGATFDQLGNLNSIPNTNTAPGQPVAVAAQGANNSNCPAIDEISTNGTVAANNALVAAQAFALAAANDNYLTTSVTTWNTHGLSGVDTSGNQTTSLTGTRLLVQDAQFAAAGAAGQVANIAFADASESVSRFSDWHNIANVANAANTAQALVYSALQDASGSSVSTQTTLNNAVNAISNTVTLIISATTPFNQQSTPSATLATNDVVALAAKLETVLNVCTAAQTAIQLAASTYRPDASGNSNISGQVGQGGSIFTVNMAYAKVTADAAVAACVAAAILAREDAVLAAKRANYSAMALRNLVGEAVVGGAVAGFVDSSGNLVTQTGYGKDASGNSYPLPFTLGGPNTVNGYSPPSVLSPTIIYQGNGGIDFNSTSNSIGDLERLSNPQPSVITNLTYTSKQYTNVYSAVADLATKAQAVLDVLQTDSSGNTADQLALPNKYLSYPNVNAVNALQSSLGITGGAGRNAVNACLISAYETQQWVVASANASFVTFGFSAANVNLVTFTPTLMGVVTKLASDADACLETVLHAEGAILYAVSQRPNRLQLHDLNSSNFASIINANQAAADTYRLLTEKAVAHENQTLIAFHKGDLANALSPLAANAKTAAAQASALGAMTWSSPTVNPNYASNAALVNANFPAGGWGSASMPALGSSLADQNANSTNPNYGPYNGTATGAAPYPAINASSSSRIQAPASNVLQASSQHIQNLLNDATLAAAKAASDAAASSVEFNAKMVEVSTVTPSLVDAATSASNLTLSAAQSAELATGLDNQGTVATNLTNFVAQLLLKEANAIFAAAQSARANLEATGKSDARYASRKNMLDQWNKAVTAVRDAVDASDEAPTNYPYFTTTTPNGTTTLLDPSRIVPASLGSLGSMGTTNGVYTTNGNTAPVWVPYGATVAGVTPSPADSTAVQYGTDNRSVSLNRPSLLSVLNSAVINAYNATTGSPDSNGNYRYITFVDASGNLQTNMPENVNDTQQAYNNSVAAFNANSALKTSTMSSLVNAAIAIQAAYNAAVVVNQQSPTYSGPPQKDANGDPYSASSPQGVFYTWANGQFGAAVTSVAVGFWNVALEYVNSLLNGSRTINATSLGNLMSIVGVNFNTVLPVDSTAQAIALANSLNQVQNDIMNAWQAGPGQSGSSYPLAYGTGTAASGPVQGGGSNSNSWPGYLDVSGNLIPTYADNEYLTAGQAWATYVNGSTASSWPSPAAFGQDSYASAYYFTVAIMGSGNVAFQTAYTAWQSVLTAYNTLVSGGSTLDTNAANANTTKAIAAYSVKIALQSAARAAASAQLSAAASSALATSTDSYEDLAAEAASEGAYASTGNLNMYRCVPDIAMHANADDLPVIFRLNGGNVYVGGTSVAASMFAGFLGVVQSHSPVNFFVNPMLYDNYTSPSPLFNSVNGALQVWNNSSPVGADIPPRLANILPGNLNPTSGLGSGLYNSNVGLGSIKGMNLGALMQVPNLVSKVSPNNTNNIVTTVYPGTSQVITAYVEPVTAYNPNLTWTSSSTNVLVSKTNGPLLSNNGQNDTDPYTTYNPLQKDASGNQLALPTNSIGDYALGSVGNVALGTNPYTGNPCLIFTATVTGVTAVAASAPLPLVTVSSTDGSSVYGQYSVVVLPAIQVTGVSISSLNQVTNPSNTTLFLGTTLQLVANVTPLNATNQRVYWWSSNTSVVNVDASGLLTSLAPGQVTVKATSVNNNISASISVYVPTPITGLSVLPTTITLNPNMGAVPLKNLGLINAIVQPAEADYKHLSWEVVSSQQHQPAPAGMTDVISLPRDGTILARDGSGDITDNTRATVSALSNGTAVIKVSTYGEPYGVYGTYTALVTVNVVTPVTDVVMAESDMVINLNPHTAQYDSSRSLPESYYITATLKPAYPSNMNVFWSSSNPKVAVVSNNSPAVLNTTVSDPNFGLWQITEKVTPLSNGTTVIKVTTADGSKTAMTTVVVTTPVTGLSMSSMPVMLNPTKLYTLQATVLPTTATNRALVWESTNTAIATVDSAGVVKAVSTGSCGISATTVDGDYTAMAEVNVVTPLVGVQLMVNTPLPIHINDVVQILVVMVPTTASNQQFTWTVTDGVDGNIFTTGPPQNGNIVYLDAVQAGNSVFTVTTADGNKQASINLQVVQW
jgi:uncharacterized protein YjdB